MPVTHKLLLPSWLVLCLISVPALVAGDEIPPGWTATTIRSFDQPPLGVTPPPADFLHSHFSDFTLSTTREARVSGSSLVWDLTPKAGTTAASLVVAEDQPALDAVAVWVKNPRQYRISLAARLTDASGETWTSPALPLANKRGWHLCFFPLDHYTGTGGKYPEPPFGTIELVLSGLQPQAYRIYLDEVQAVSAPPPRLRVKNLVAPGETRAGAAVPVRATVQLTSPLTRPMPLLLELERAGIPVAVSRNLVSPQKGDRLSCDFTLSIPRHIRGGAYALRLTSDAALISSQPSRSLQVDAAAEAGKFSVCPPGQGGSFAVNGTPLSPLGGLYLGRQAPRQAPWIVFYATCDYDATGRAATVWTAPDKFDYSALDLRIARLLAASPDAYLVPVVYISSPPWWDARHPKELMVFGDGKTRLPDSVPLGKRTFASWASSVWRQDATSALVKLVRHLESGPCGPAIIGYELASGENGGWVYPGASYGVFADYSHPQQEAFRAWLRHKYHDLRSLRLAWGQPGAPVLTPEALKEFHPILGWNQVKIPSEVKRLRDSVGVLREPTAAEDIIDYQDFSSDLVVETIRLLAGAVKKATGNRKLVGAIYGNVFDLAGTRSGVQNGGQLAMAPVFQAPELDFITSASPAAEAGQPPLLTTAQSSLAYHGKLWLSMATRSAEPAAVANGLCGGGAVAVAGYSPGTVSTALPAPLAGADRSSLSQVAIVVDGASLAYTGCGSELLKPLLDDQRLAISLLGAPCDVWTLSDIIGGRAPAYKMYLFLDAFYLDTASRNRLAALLEQHKCTAVWVYAPGAIDESIGSRTMKDLTGLTIIRRPGEGLLQVKVGGAEGYVYGSPLPAKPRFAASDARADVRGQLVGTPFAGLAVLDLGKLTSVWSAAPHLPVSLLRDLATDAGVHLYDDADDGVCACHGLLAVRASTAGEHKISLPGTADVYDLNSGQLLGRQVHDFQVQLAARKIGLYRLIHFHPAGQP